MKQVKQDYNKDGRSDSEEASDVKTQAESDRGPPPVRRRMIKIWSFIYGRPIYRAIMSFTSDNLCILNFIS